MKDVYITIHPMGWFAVAAIVVLIFIVGYVVGAFHEWKRLMKRLKKTSFDFESKRK